MRNKVIATVTFIVLLVTAAGAFAQEGKTGANVQTSSVYRVNDDSEVEGSFARLVRYEDGVTMTISTHDLKPGEVYTIWWVIFNTPENCSNGVCNEDDIFVMSGDGIPRDDVGNIMWEIWEARGWSTKGLAKRDDAGNRILNTAGIEAANISILHASGSYVTDGTLTVSASLAEGNGPGTVFGPGLLDARTSEIHLVVRTNGPAVDEYFADQVSTFGGGCDSADALPCTDVQLAMFGQVSG